MKLLRRLLTTLETPAPSLARYILRAAPLSLLPSLAIVGLAIAPFRWLGFDTTFPADPAPASLWLDLVGIVMVGPMLETLCLALVLALLGLSALPERGRAVVAALFWAALHGLFHPLWFFGSVWGFFVFSIAFLTWRRVSYRHALVAASSVHGLHNLAVVALAYGWHLIEGMK